MIRNMDIFSILNFMYYRIIVGILMNWIIHITFLFSFSYMKSTTIQSDGNSSTIYFLWCRKEVCLFHVLWWICSWLEFPSCYAIQIQNDYWFCKYFYYLFGKMRWVVVKLCLNQKLGVFWKDFSANIIINAWTVISC